MAADKRSDTRSVANHGRTALVITDPTDELSAAEALALAEEAEAEAAEAAAMAAAARARVRAIRLRRQVSESDVTDTAADGDDGDPDGVVAPIGQAEPAEDSDSDSEDDETVTGEPPERQTSRARRWFRRPRLRTVISALALVLVVALLTATGYMLWQHHHATEQRQRAADFAAAARQGVVTLMSLDFNRAKEGVQQIVDDSTGPFKTDFEAQADTMVKAVQDSKVVATASVSAVAVQSMTSDSAVVLVAAKSEVTNSTGANKDPRMWRLSVTVARDGSQIKLSRVEFVP